MDCAPCYDYKKHPLWDSAIERVYDRYGRLFADIEHNCIATLDDIVADMDMTRSSGVPWGMLKMKTKGDCFRSPVFRNYLAHPELMVPPVWKVVDKSEWYHANDIDSGKVRTFIIPPTDFLVLQKICFWRQNEAMKMRHSSAYGFNPYRGGVHRLALKLLRNPIFLSYDVRGWDRLLPHMREVYDLRLSFIPEEMLYIAEWVSDNTIITFLIYPDGTIVCKILGNNSGSGTTTSDNILAHDFISCLVLLEIFGESPDLLEAAVQALFGDDNVSSIPETPVDLETTYRSIFRLFGLELDPFKTSRDLRDMEFLGFKFEFRDGWWIPCYNEGRILASFCYEIDKKNESMSICKAYSLCVMSFGGKRETFDLMCAALEVYLSTLLDSEDPTIQTFVALGPPSYEDCFSFFTGRESDPFSDSLVGGGIKEFINEFPTKGS
jgi:hypothetical protein